jgi:hypothetical protein
VVYPDNVILLGNNKKKKIESSLAWQCTPVIPSAGIMGNSKRLRYWDYRQQQKGEAGGSLV